jgi:hypothetical protein
LVNKITTQSRRGNREFSHLFGVICQLFTNFDSLALGLAPQLKAALHFIMLLEQARDADGTIVADLIVGQVEGGQCGVVTTAQYLSAK